VDIRSDRNPLIGIFKSREKRIANEKKSRTYIFLSDIEKREVLKNELDKHIRFDNNNKDENIEDQWCQNGIYYAIEGLLG